jgi:hypothetical protein
LLALLLGGWLAHRVLNRSATVVGGATPQAPRVPLENIDHAPFDALLQKYVDREGLVAYAKWKANAGDLQLLDDYLAHLGLVDLAAPASQQAQLAYWINAYNAITLKGVLGLYPINSIKEHASSLKYDPRLKTNLWYDLYLKVGERTVNLTDIEHKILRPMGDPRIHFALVCASRGCPPLRNRAYTAENVDQALDDNARRFFRLEQNFIGDGEARTLSFSEMLGWYAEDFGKTPLELVRRVRPFLPEKEVDWLDDRPIRVDYDLKYDWSLNDQGP